MKRLRRSRKQKEEREIKTNCGKKTEQERWYRHQSNWVNTLVAHDKCIGMESSEYFAMSKEQSIKPCALPSSSNKLSTPGLIAYFDLLMRTMPIKDKLADM